MTNMISTSTTKLAAPKPEALRSNATDRAYNSFLRTIGRETTKANKADLERAKAISVTIPRFLETLDGDGLAGFFFALERLATASNKRRIATHPLRPDIVEDMLAEAIAEDEARSSEEANAAKAAEAIPQQNKAKDSASS